MTVSEITAAKAEFALALHAAGLDVMDYVPGRVTPPVVIISAATPYLIPETIGNEYEMNLDLKCIAMTSDNELATNSLDLLIEQTIHAIASIRYVRFKTVGQPYALDTGNASYLSADVSIALSITL